MYLRNTQPGGQHHQQPQGQRHTQQQLPQAAPGSARQYSSASGGNGSSSSNVVSAAGPVPPTDDPEVAARYEAQEQASERGLQDHRDWGSAGVGDDLDSDQDHNLQEAAENWV